MLTLASGRERTAAEFEDLFARSGLALVDRHRMITGFTAFELERLT
jgi:hypothetical protein